MTSHPMQAPSEPRWRADNFPQGQVSALGMLAEMSSGHTASNSLPEPN